MIVKCGWTAMADTGDLTPLHRVLLYFSLVSIASYIVAFNSAIIPAESATRKSLHAKSELFSPAPSH